MQNRSALSECGHLRPAIRSVKDAHRAAFQQLASSSRVAPELIDITQEQTDPMIELLAFISYLLTLYVYILIAAAVLSWLIAFNVVNTHNNIVAVLGAFLYRITDPVLRPIRNVMPDLGGIDISPVIVILIIVFIQNVIIPNIAKALI
jgi:YggT family protein